jgi:GntR family transcriptional regulator
MLQVMNNSGPSLSRTPGTSLHRQIFLVLRDGITHGMYPAGSALPTEETLMRTFGVARVTVRRALADLEAEGLVQRRHGRGTFVLGAAPSGAPAATLSYVDGLRNAAQNTSVRVLAIETSVPPSSIAALLQLGKGEAAMRIARLRSAGNTPLMLTDSWMPSEFGKRITPTALRKRALYQLLMDRGVRIGRVVQQISAEAADPVKAQLLQCEVSASLVRLTRLLHDKSGRPVQYLTVHMSPQRSCILMDIPSEAIDTLSTGHIVHDPGLLANFGSKRRNSR